MNNPQPMLDKKSDKRETMLHENKNGHQSNPVSTITQTGIGMYNMYKYSYKKTNIPLLHKMLRKLIWFRL